MTVNAPIRAGEVLGKVVDRSHIGALVGVLLDRGFTVAGPTKSDAAISYAEIDSIDDLPAGWTDHQEPGTYRLVRRDDDALFGYVGGQTSWKRFLYPPHSELLHIRRHDDGSLDFSEPAPENRRYAFIGVRGCELAAIAIQDTVFLDSGYVDRTYEAKRRDLFLVAVNCAVVGGTCFCASMGTGPECTDGFDVVLTEVIDRHRHEFVCRSGTVAGAEVLALLPGRIATEDDLATVAGIIETSAASMGRDLDTRGLPELLAERQDHPRWDEVATRCLACTNCTLACPTCFCSTTEDVAALDASGGTRSRRWDSCFTMDFSSLHGAPVRHSIKSRYRQWLTHKLSGWHEQFGTSGCVGCGRCITWCPVGIDITKEAAAIRREVGT